MLFLGIDGGQTKTLCIIGDEKGNILSLGKGRALIHILSPEGPKIAEKAFKEAVESSTSFIGENFEIEVAFLGLTGVPYPDSEEARAFEKIAQKVIKAKKIFIDSDPAIALAGAFSGGPGIIVIGGTGSVSFGYDGEKYARCGGFGYLFGDEGGGFQIALQGLKIALKFEDGCHPYTLIREKILKDFNFSSIEEIVRKYYSKKIERSEIAFMTRSIRESAEEGDKFAREILFNAGLELSKLCDCVYKKLNFKDKVFVSGMGGVFNISFVKESFIKNLDPQKYILKEPDFPSIVGALIKAYQMADIEINEEIKKNLKNSNKFYS